MRVYQAETGVAISINIPLTETVESLKKLLTLVTNIKPENQILLDPMGIKLDNQQLLSQYENKKVFLFSRRTFASMNSSSSSSSSPSGTSGSVARANDSIATLGEEFRAFDLEVPARPSIQMPNEIQNIASTISNNDSSMQLMLEYAKNFYYHIRIADSVVRAAQLRQEACLRSKAEQKVQSEAVMAAVRNLNGHSSQISQALAMFVKRFHRQAGRHQQLVSGFEQDLQKLSKVTLHPLLRTPSKTTLLDCVPEPQLRLWCEKCAKDLATFKSKVADIEQVSRALEQGVEAENKTAVDVDFRLLDSYLLEVSALVEDQQTIRQALINDYQRIIDALTPTQNNNNSNAINDMYNAIEYIYKQHENEHLKKMKSNDDRLKRLSILCCSDSKRKLTEHLYERVRSISQLQSKIRNLGNKIAMYSEALNKQNDNFSHLVLVHRLPRVYTMALVEVVRRRRYGRRFMSEISRLTERILRLREGEDAKRMQFAQRFGRYLPPGLGVLVSSLNDPLPPCEVRSPPFDTSLPNIDSLQDIDSKMLALLKQSLLKQNARKQQKRNDEEYEEDEDEDEEGDEDEYDDDAEFEHDGGGPFNQEEDEDFLQQMDELFFHANADDVDDDDYNSTSSDPQFDGARSNNNESSRHHDVESASVRVMLKEKEEAISKLNEIVSRLEDQKAQYDEKITLLEQELASLSKLQTLEREKQRREFEERIKQEKNALEQYRQEELKRALAQLEQANNELKRVRQECEQYETAAKNSQERFSTAVKEIASHLQALGDAKRELDQARTSLAQAEEERNAAKSELLRVQQEVIPQKERAYKSLLDTSTELKRELAAREEQISELKFRCAEAANRVQQCEQELAEAKAQMEKQRQEERSSILSAEQDKWKQALDAIKEENEELRRNLAYKENIRHQTALNAAHNEKRLYQCMKQLDSLKRCSSAYAYCLHKLASTLSLNEVASLLSKAVEKDDHGLVLDLQLIQQQEQNSVAGSGDSDRLALAKHLADKSTGLILILEGATRVLQENEKLAAALDIGSNEMKVALSKFQPRQNAIWIQNGRGNYEAIHRGDSPHYFLSEISLHAAVQQQQQQHQRSDSSSSATTSSGSSPNKSSSSAAVKYLIGEIIYLDERVATSEYNGNPYHLKEGTPYYVVDAEIRHAVS